jgi:hypothetical protein
VLGDVDEPLPDELELDEPDEPESAFLVVSDGLDEDEPEPESPDPFAPARLSVR